MLRIVAAIVAVAALLAVVGALVWTFAVPALRLWSLGRALVDPAVTVACVPLAVRGDVKADLLGVAAAAAVCRSLESATAQPGRFDGPAALLALPPHARIGGRADFPADPFLTDDGRRALAAAAGRHHVVIGGELRTDEHGTTVTLDVDGVPRARVSAGAALPVAGAVAAAAALLDKAGVKTALPAPSDVDAAVPPDVDALELRAVTAWNPGNAAAWARRASVTTSRDEALPMSETAYFLSGRRADYAVALGENLAELHYDERVRALAAFHQERKGPGDVDAAQRLLARYHQNDAR